MTAAPNRPDFDEILRLVPQGARVLDVGCGEGDLLERLVRENRVDGRGLEVRPENVSACLARGLSVVQGDADRDLDDFPDKAFDHVILSQTLQAVTNPRHVLGEMLRIGERAVVSFPNFGHWRVRLDLLLHGRMPVTGSLPDPWWATPNIHLCTLADFTVLCREMNLVIEVCAALSSVRAAKAIDPASAVGNWSAESALFLLRRRGS